MKKLSVESYFGAPAASNNIVNHFKTSDSVNPFAVIIGAYAILLVETELKHADRIVKIASTVKELGWGRIPYPLLLNYLDVEGSSFRVQKRVLRSLGKKCLKKLDSVIPINLFGQNTYPMQSSGGAQLVTGST